MNEQQNQPKDPQQQTLQQPLQQPTQQPFQQPLQQAQYPHMENPFQYPLDPAHYSIEQVRFGWGGAGWVLPLLFLTPFFFNRGGHDGGNFVQQPPLPVPFPYYYPLPTPGFTPFQPQQNFPPFGTYY